MKRQVLFGMVAIMGVISALGQPPPAPPQPPPQPPGPPMQPMQRPAAKPAEEPALRGEAKLRWIGKRLQLNEAQTQQMDALLAAYNAEVAEGQQNPLDMARKLQEKSAEIQNAKAQGDEAKVEALRQELRDMAPEARAEKAFFEAFEQNLTAAQKARLGQLRELAKDPKSASLRPVHVLRAAREVGLAPEQDRRLEDVLDAFRKNLLVDRPKDQAASEERVEQLVRDVRAVLTPAQTAKFDEQIDKWRISAPAPVPMQMHAPTPKPPEAPKPPEPPKQP
jgi:hypothetical protein